VRVTRFLIPGTRIVAVTGTIIVIVRTVYTLRQHVDDRDLRCSSRQQRTQSPFKFHRNSSSRTVTPVLDYLHERAAGLSPQFHRTEPHMVRTRIVLSELA
jgi:hypothetical protein